MTWWDEFGWRQAAASQQLISRYTGGNWAGRAVSHMQEMRQARVAADGLTVLPLQVSEVPVPRRPAFHGACTAQ